MQMLERLAWTGMMYAQAGMPVEAADTARRMDDIATKVDSVSMPLTLRNELTKAYAAAYSGNSERARQLTQAVRDYPNCPNTARLESLSIDALDARWHEQAARAREIALQLAEGVEASKLPVDRRGLYFSIAATSLLSANDLPNAQRVLARAAGNYREAGVTPSVLMSEFINAKAQMGLANGDKTVPADLQALASAWQRVNPNSDRHGETLYWLSRTQDAAGQSEAAVESRRQAVGILKKSKLPAMRGLSG
jgi:hypothetical protein